MTDKRHSPPHPVFGWIDTPWTVAAILGIWGVMIGIEEYRFADYAASIAVVFAAIRLVKETLIWTRRRRTLPFVLGFIVLICLLAGDF